MTSMQKMTGFGAPKRRMRRYPVAIFCLSNLVFTFAGPHHRVLLFSALAVSLVFMVISIGDYLASRRGEHTSVL